MEYITEYRGGYDEWSDKYEAVVGILLDDGTEISRFADEIFTDQDGNAIEVEFPPRRHDDRPIRIERYDPSYDYWDVSSLSKLENITDEADRVIDVSRI